MSTETSAGSPGRTDTELIQWFEDLSSRDTARVGGKNASLGEMIQHLGAEGICVPDGFATTSAMYRQFLDANDLEDRIADRIDDLHDGAELSQVGADIRRMFLDSEFPGRAASAITDAYHELARRLGIDEPSVAVRSSATAEDLPEASFAGQQESFLNIRGDEALLEACRRCYASLFTDRAINYREDQDFDHREVALSVGVQQMVRSDLASAGVMFTIDTDTGFPDTVIIDGSWGLGESVVAGEVDPDEYLVFKPMLDDDALNPVISQKTGSKATKIVYSDAGDPDADPTTTLETSEQERRSRVLTDDEARRLARWAVTIEQHYGTPMDIEWAKDGQLDELFIVQARPETVQARKSASTMRSFRLTERGEQLTSGVAIGDAIAAGTVCRLMNASEIDRFEPGAVLVTRSTDPDWEPIMERAAAIVTDQGGRTSHAAIVSRELGVAAVIGCGDATEVLSDGHEVTVSCAEGDEGHVYDGILDIEEREIELGEIPETDTEVMFNLANPGAAFRWWRLPTDGVGLARMEFIVNNNIAIHPMALLRPDEVDDDDRQRIDELVRGYDDPAEYFVERLAFGIARIAAASWPRPVIVRTSDFKTNEYAGLLGGKRFEPSEENPMLGWRGASRYYHEQYREGFGLECAALRRVRDEMGLTNVIVMIPFCRTLDEADRVLEELAERGLQRGRNGLEIYVMAEIPSNIILAEEFAARFDGFSIGSNDLTQLTLGVDRDSDMLSSLFDERDPAVVSSIERLIEVAHGHGRKVGLCGQRPSDDPDFAALLVRAGIDSISVSPDSFLQVKQHIADAESGSGSG